MKNRAFEYSVAPIAQRVQKVQKIIRKRTSHLSVDRQTNTGLYSYVLLIPYFRLLVFGILVTLVA